MTGYLDGIAGPRDLGGLPPRSPSPGGRPDGSSLRPSDWALIHVAAALARTRAQQQAPTPAAAPAPPGPEAADPALDPAGLGDAANALDPLGLSPPPAQQPSGWFLDPSDFRSRFYDKHYAAAARALAPYNVDPALALGVAAQESGWGKNSQSRQGNPGGYMPNGKAASFASPDAFWQAWARDFGPRVKGVGGDAEAFVRNLATDGRPPNPSAPGGKTTGPYNKDDPSWATKLGGGMLPDGSYTIGTIRSVRATLPRWRGNLDGLP